MRDAIRAQIVKRLGWDESHVDVETAVAGMPRRCKAGVSRVVRTSACHLGQFVAVRQQLGAWKR